LNLDVFVHGDGSVDLDHPIDAWTAEPGRGRSGEFPSGDGTGTSTISAPDLEPRRGSMTRRLREYARDVGSLRLGSLRVSGGLSTVIMPDEKRA